VPSRGPARLVGRIWRWAFPPAPLDPRYRVLERWDVREAVRIEVPLIVAIVLANLALTGPGWRQTDLLAAVAAALFALLVVGRRSIVLRYPYAAAISVGIITLTLIAAALVELPTYSTLLLGDYAVVVVGSALLVTLNEAAHRAWLAASMVPLVVGLALADVTAATRVYGALVCAAALVTSLAGNSLVQRRRERQFAQETLLRRQRRELRDAVARLEAADATIARLEGVLPICSHCKRVRDRGDVWVRIETYVEKRSAAQFSHGICPDCMSRYYGGLDKESD
jgi:hypothetical protein